MFFSNKIPKNIFMAWEGEAPKWVRNTFKLFSEMNKDFNCVLIDNLDIPKDSPFYDYSKGYDEYKFFKADLYRYHTLNKYGGIWIDCDTFPFKPIDKFLLRKKNFIVKTRPRGTNIVEEYMLDNYFMGCEKDSTFIKEILKRIERKIYLLKKFESPYDVSMFKLFKQEEIRKYVEPLDTSYTEEASYDECRNFFEWRNIDTIEPFNEESYLKHFRNNQYKNYLKRRQ